MSNEELKCKEFEYIQELNMLLDNYKIVDRALLWFLGVISFIIIFGIYLMFRYILTLVILAIVLFALNRFKISFANAQVKKEVLAERVCQLMEFLVEIKKGTYTSYGGVAILTEQTGKHLILYKEFITLYPQFKSKKLESLAKVDIKSKYFS